MEQKVKIPFAVFLYFVSTFSALEIAHVWSLCKNYANL